MRDFDEIRCLDATLAEKLELYSQEMWQHRTVVAEVYADLVDRLLAADAGSHALQTGATLPGFVLPDSNGHLIHSADLLRQGPLVISFNRGKWCSFCRLELSALADIHADITGMGGSIVSIMPERSVQTQTLVQTLDLPYPVLTDIDNGYALSCGLMISLGNSLRELFLSRGTNLAPFHGNNSWFVPIPVTYIVDQSGVIRESYIDADFRRRMQPEAILAAVQKIASGE